MRLMDLHQRLCQQRAINLSKQLAFGIGLASKDKQLKIAVEALEKIKSEALENPTFFSNSVWLTADKALDQIRKEN